MCDELPDVHVGDKVRVGRGNVIHTVRKVDRSGDVAYRLARLVSDRTGRHGLAFVRRLTVVERTPAQQQDGRAIAEARNGRTPEIQVGDVVTFGKSAMRWQVIEEQGNRLVCKARHRMQRTYARDRLTLVCRQGDPSMTWYAFSCDGCLAQNWLSIFKGGTYMDCGICGRSGWHRYLDTTDGGYCERRNEAHRDELGRQLRQLDESLAMLDQLGVRVCIEELDEHDCSMAAERGRGKTTWFINLDSRLPVARQVACLGRVWTYLLPANEHRWSERQWHQDGTDPAIEYLEFWWDHKYALIDDEAIQRAMR